MTCGWCDKPSTGERVVEPEQWGKRKNPATNQEEDVLVKRAITVGVCAEHVEIFNRAERVSTLLDRRRALYRHRDGAVRSVDRSSIQEQIDTLTTELEALGWVDTVSR